MKQVRPKKNLGQHFLTDLTIARRIADTVDACPGLPVLEVGPGMGVLTQYLVKKNRPVRVVEIDSESVAYLHEHFAFMNDDIIGEDFLRMDLTRCSTASRSCSRATIPTTSRRRYSSRCSTTATSFPAARA